MVTVMLKRKVKMLELYHSLKISHTKAEMGICETEFIFLLNTEESILEKKYSEESIQSFWE